MHVDELIFDEYSCFACMVWILPLVVKLWKYPLITCETCCLNYTSRNWIHKLWKYPLVTCEICCLNYASFSWIQCKYSLVICGTCWCEFYILDPNAHVVRKSTGYLWNLLFIFFTFNMNSHILSIMCGNLFSLCFMKFY